MGAARKLADRTAAPPYTLEMGIASSLCPGEKEEVGGCAILRNVYGAETGVCLHPQAQHCRRVHDALRGLATNGSG